MRKFTFLLLLTALLATACGTNPKAAYNDLHEDDVHFAADESFQPILSELSDLYALRKPEATMMPVYCSEDSALRLLLNDSVRMAITTQPLNDRQKEENTDTVINLEELRGIVQGRITDWKQLEVTHRSGKLSLVFDGSGSSTVRYMKDSLNGGKELKGNIFAQGSNLKVIEAVKENPNVIGVVSTDWLRQQKGDSTTIQSFQGLDVNVMLVGKLGKKAGDWQRPYQYYIATGEYPLVRSVWAISTDPRTRSTLKSFYFFLKDNVGQRVICNSSQLLPRNQVQVREVNVR